MKKITFLTMISLIVLLLGFREQVHGQLIDENFDYVAGTDLLSNPPWAITGTSTTNVVKVSNGGLSYTGYPSSGIGNAADLVTTGQDVNRPFTIQSAGSIYAAFLVSFTSTQATGDYFFHFIQDPVSGNIFKARVFAKKDATTSAFAFGLSKSSTATATIAYTGFIYSLNTTYLLVLKYQFNTGTTTDDNVTLYVDPVLGGGEPATPTLTYIDNTQTDATNLGMIALRQGTATNAPILRIDGIRVADSWASVTGSGSSTPTISSSVPSLSGFNYIQGSGPSTEQSFTISGSNLTDNISVAPPTNYEISTGSGAGFVPTNPVVLTQSGGAVAATSIYVRLKAGLSAGTYNSEAITATSTGSTNVTVTCNGSVTPPLQPVITVDSASLSGFVAVYGSPSASHFYKVSGENLLEGVTVTAPAKYEVSTDDINYSSSLVLPMSGGILVGQPVTVYARIAATAAYGSATGNITHTSNSATTLNLSVAGNVIYPEPTNHVTSFAAVAQSHSNIVVNWNDNHGTTAATGFLILANKTGVFTDPVDGVPVANYYALNDSSAATNVVPGVNTYNWFGLLSNTQFFFKIYPYTNTGMYINYLTTAPVPTASATTLPFVNPIAAWTFDVLSGSPNTPRSVVANFGLQTGTATFYADSTNGSSSWKTSTELDSFGGTTVNDPREGTQALAGSAYVLKSSTANGKSIVFKFSMSALQDPILTYATRHSSTAGFNKHYWAWSTDGQNFTLVDSTLAPTSALFVTKTLNLTAVDALDGAPVVYLRLTVNGATTSTSNNRLDNIVIHASAASTIAPTVFTLPATNVGNTTATLNGTVNANNQESTVSFEYGDYPNYQYSAPAVPAVVNGGTVTSVSADITGLQINTTYHFRVKAVNNSGTSYGADMTFTTACPIPDPAGEVSGPSEVCADGTTQYQYSVDAIPYASSYVWSIPAGGSIASGDGTNSISVIFAPGTDPDNISVFGTNDCGDGDASSPFAVSVTQPAAVSVSIVASANPVTSGTSVTFTATPVNGGTSPIYHWNVNNFWYGNQGPEYTYVPADGDVVYCALVSSLSCKTGSPANSNSITMSVTSALPENLTVTGTLSSGNTCYNATNTITVAGGATTFEMMAGSSATFIAGQKILYLPGTMINAGAYMHGYISTGTYCEPGDSPALVMDPEKKVSDPGVAGSFRIYPNPTTGKFTVESKGTLPAEGASIEIFSSLGTRILTAKLDGKLKEEISILGHPQGVYFVKISSGEEAQTAKIILTR